MKAITTDFLLGIFAAAIFSVAMTLSFGVSASEEEIAEIRRQLSEMKSEYESRIAELERRLKAAEAATSSDAVSRQTPTSLAGSVTAANDFNPRISAILDGNYYHDELDGAGADMHAEIVQPSQPGHHEDEHSHTAGTESGFNLRSVELAFSATVDPYFDASVYLAVDSDGSTEIEEAWFETRSLPWGVKLKGGKFLSDFGYLNSKHPHQWDFVDQNLPYLNILGDHGLQDTGVQVTWLPELPIYTLLGTEILQGDQERLGTYIDDADERSELGLNDQENGPRMFTMFAKFSPELGYDHTLQLGGSYVYHQQHQEILDAQPGESGLEGDASLWGLDLVYAFDNAAAYGHRDLRLQAEYLRSIKDLGITGGEAGDIGGNRKLTTDGFYAQGLYGFAPRWQAGLRYDVVGLTNKATGDFPESLDSSDRWTLALTWTPTEFSRFRLQYSHSDILVDSGTRENYYALWLQFLMSMGAHGAHEF